MFVHTFFFPVLGASLHHRVLSSLPVRGRASSLSSATVKQGSRVGTSGLTAGSWYVLAGTARLPACAVVHLSQVILTPKAASPSQRASAAWTIGCLSISLKLKPSAVRRVRVSKSRGRSRERERISGGAAATCARQHIHKLGPVHAQASHTHFSVFGRKMCVNADRCERTRARELHMHSHAHVHACWHEDTHTHDLD